MALGRRGRERAINYWPGFVDALSTLLLVFTFCSRFSWLRNSS